MSALSDPALLTLFALKLTALRTQRPPQRSTPLSSSSFLPVIVTRERNNTFTVQSTRLLLGTGDQTPLTKSDPETAVCVGRAGWQKTPSAGRARPARRRR